VYIVCKAQTNDVSTLQLCIALKKG